jgi:RhoGAP domain
LEKEFGGAIKHDIHAVSSLLKMYFRELPNPLCTYQLYEKFVAAAQGNFFLELDSNKM